MPEMGKLRRALLFASGGRYIVMGINLSATIVLARLLTPAEFGITVLGTALLGIAEALRELGSVAYLVQEQEITAAKIRTVFTVSLIVTLVLTTVLLCLSGVLADFYGVPGVGRYIRVVAISYAIAPFAHPIYALLSRDMAFDRVATLDICATLASAICAVCLALLGYSYMSLAWAAVASALVWTLLGLGLRRNFSVYQFCLLEWRNVLAFGFYGSATAVLYRISESLFYLMLGRVLNAGAAGVCQRAVMLTLFPERVILAGIGAVALPAFSAHARDGHDLKGAYFKAIEHVTAVLWPALILLAILANPIVSIVFGPQWKDVAPILQIFAVSHLFNFPTALNYAIQVAVGAIRHTVPLALLQTMIALTVLGVAAGYGLRAVALSTLLTIPLNVGLSVWLVCRHVPFRIGELAAAMKKSAFMSVMSAAGPLAVALHGRGDFSTPWMATAAILFAGGWLGGLKLTRHPLFAELRHAGTVLTNWGVVKLPI